MEQGRNTEGDQARDLLSEKMSEVFPGPADTWPRNLLAVLDICHASAVPMAVYWGGEFIFFCNIPMLDLLRGAVRQGHPAREVIPEIWNNIHSSLERVKAGHAAETIKDQCIQFHDDRERFFDSVFTPIPGSHKRENEHIPCVSPDGVLHILNETTRDLTQRRNAEQELRESKEKLQKFNATLEQRIERRTAAMMSYQKQLRSLAFRLSNAEEHERQRLATELHDNLGQILAVCKMELDLLKKEEISPQVSEGMKSLGSMMDEAIRYTRELMTDLKPPPSLKEEELGSILSWVSNKMQIHGLNVTISDDGRKKELDEQIRITILQSARELLFNVVKHARVREALIVITHKEKEVEVVIEDEGIGFNPDDIRISEGKEGGFGLFSIWERMDLIGGSFRIVSEPGKGTKVTLTAPVKLEGDPYLYDHESKTNTATNRPLVHPRTGQRIRVLLVDDHKILRAGLKEIIVKKSDMEVVGEASNGLEAVELTRKITPDVIVMDIDMPVLNGIDATRKIKSFAPDIHIIGLSFHREKEVKQAMLNAGASVYLKKSEVFETLCATIQSEVMMKSQ